MGPKRESNKSATSNKSSKSNAKISAAGNKFDVLDNTEAEKCALCDTFVDKWDEFYFKCHTCCSLMHQCCVDPDMPDEAAEYLCSGNAPPNIFYKCHNCQPATSPNLTNIERRLSNIEHLLTNADTLAVVEPPCSNTGKQPNPAATKTTKPGPTVQEGITEALEQERRKLNLIVFNMATSTSDTVKLASLFEHISGDPSPTFRCSRIGKPSTDKKKTQPVLVKFDSEEDRNSILRYARNLRDMKAEWPKVSIAPDRTKRQQQLYNDLRAQCDQRRADGEHVLIVNYQIVHDKRPPRTAARSNAVDDQPDQRPPRRDPATQSSPRAATPCSHNNVDTRTIPKTVN